MTVVRRDWLTPEFLAKLGLSKRQKIGVAILRTEGSLTSGRYQEATGASRQTVARDLDELVKRGVLKRHGERKATYYTKAQDMPHL